MGDERRDGAVGDLGVRVMRPHDAIHVADHDRFDLKRAEFTMTALCEVIAAGFDLNQSGEKEWMHGFVRARGEVLDGRIAAVVI